MPTLAVELNIKTLVSYGCIADQHSQIEATEIDCMLCHFNSILSCQQVLQTLQVL